MELEYILGIYTPYLTFFNFFVTALALGILVAVTQYFEWYNVLLFGLLTVAYVLLDRPGGSLGGGSPLNAESNGLEKSWPAV